MGTNNHQKVTSEWIPVSERLPNSMSTVIVQIKGIKKPTFGWFFPIGGWRLLDKDFTEFTRFSVIAWMPLPEPYVSDTNVGNKKEQNDDI